MRVIHPEMAGADIDALVEPQTFNSNLSPWILSAIRREKLGFPLISSSFGRKHLKILTSEARIELSAAETSVPDSEEHGYSIATDSEISLKALP